MSNPEPLPGTAVPDEFREAAYAVFTSAPRNMPSFIAVYSNPDRPGAEVFLFDPDDIAARGIGPMLHELADLVRSDPGDLKDAAVLAAAVPETGIAYLLRPGRRVIGITLNASPHDEPALRNEIISGLLAIAEAAHDRPAPRHARGAFPVLNHLDSNARPSTFPITPPPGGHNHTR